MRWVHVVLDAPPAVLERTATFWSRALGWPLGPEWPGHPELRSFQPRRGDPYVHLQAIEGEPRVHVDLEVADLDAERDRAASLGARVGCRLDEWQQMRSPGGLPFCRVAEAPHAGPPPPLLLGPGHRTRLVQGVHRLSG